MSQPVELRLERLTPNREDDFLAPMARDELPEVPARMRSSADPDVWALSCSMVLDAFRGQGPWTGPETPYVDHGLERVGETTGPFAVYRKRLGA